MTSMETADFASAVKHSGGVGSGGLSDRDTEVPLASHRAQDRPQFGGGRYINQSRKSSRDVKYNKHHEEETTLAKRSIFNRIKMEDAFQERLARKHDQSRPRRRDLVAEVEKKNDTAKRSETNTWIRKSHEEKRRHAQVPQTLLKSAYDADKHLKELYAKSAETRKPVAIRGPGRHGKHEIYGIPQIVH
jgi:hypothetical protein